MDELGINGFDELDKEISKFKEIKPQSEINLKDCENFWNDIFNKEIPKDLSVEPDSLEKGIDNRNKTKESTYEFVKQFWNDVFSGPIESTNDVKEGTRQLETQEGLTCEKKAFIKKETGWSDEVINSIRSMDEYKIYKDANLIEGEVNGKKCLMKTDIDWEHKDQFGMTNSERVAEGLAPLDKTGKPIELHHIGQKSDSPLAELSFTEHRTGGNDTILHDKTKKTEVHGDGNSWSGEREAYWKNRLQNGGDS